MSPYDKHILKKKRVYNNIFLPTILIFDYDATQPVKGSYRRSFEPALNLQLTDIQLKHFMLKPHKGRIQLSYVELQQYILNLVPPCTHLNRMDILK